MKGAMSRQALLVIILAVLSAWSVAMSAETSTPAEFANTLMPQPSQPAAQEGRLIITSSFTATAYHFRDPRLDAAVTRVLDRLKMHTAIAIGTSLATSTPSTLIVSVGGSGEKIQTVNEDESYSLDV